MIVKKTSPEKFLRTIELFMWLSLLIGEILSVNFVGIKGGLSFLFGWIVGFLNFRSTKKDGMSTIFRVMQGLSPQKGVFVYMSKFYLRLFATGVLLFVGIGFLKFNIFLVLAGIIIVYLQVLIGSFYNLYIRKLEIA